MAIDVFGGSCGIEEASFGGFKAGIDGRGGGGEELVFDSHLGVGSTELSASWIVVHGWIREDEFCFDTVGWRTRD